MAPWSNTRVRQSPGWLEHDGSPGAEALGPGIAALDPVASVGGSSICPGIRV